MLTTTEMKIISLDPVNPAMAPLSEAARLLQMGSLVVAPTETRYGLLARADRDDSLDRLCSVKGRSPRQPMSIFVSDPESIGRFAQLTPSAESLAKAFLPGPLTLVLPAAVRWGEPIVIDGKVGLRCSSSPIIAGILKYVDFPVTATSANKSGAPDLATAAEISDVFQNLVDLYLDAGPLRNQTSTVVDCCGAEIVILREGAVSTAAIQAALHHSGGR